MYLLSNGPEATESLAVRLAASLKPGDIITLQAPLGAGKTTFVRGLAYGLGVNADEVSSPTFVLWQIYAGRLRLHHLDAYRLNKVEQLEDIGLSEILYGNDVVVIEWPELAKSLLPTDFLEISIAYAQEEQGRELYFQGYGCWKQRLQGIWP